MREDEESLFGAEGDAAFAFVDPEIAAVIAAPAEESGLFDRSWLDAGQEGVVFDG